MSKPTARGIMKSCLNPMGIHTMVSKYAVRFMRGLLAFCLLFIGPIRAEATPSSQAQPKPSASPTYDLNDPKEVKAFVDTFFTEQMQESHIPGAVFVLVKDGSVLFAQGYGYADIQQQTLIDPATTVFRVQSISKLFTATAVMQLVEHGQLDLHTDVNTYLRDFQLSPRFSPPVTTDQLLTHTSGLDLVAAGVSARTIGEQEPLGAYLRRAMPKRILPSGLLYSYNNHGISLAGYLVEEISGKPFPQYIDEYILQPLDMRHSSFDLRADLAPHMATEYSYRAGAYESVPFDYLNTLPAGGLNATANDMAHFMIAHLQNGRYLDRRILSEETAKEMHRQHFTAHPQLPGMAYGFHEYFQNGLRAIEQGGTWTGSTSELMIFPDQNFGFFLSYTRNEEGLRDRFTKEFIDTFFPSLETNLISTATSSTQSTPARWAGSYRPVSFVRTDLFKLGALLYEYQITDNADGTISLHYPSAKEPTVWQEIGPLLFQRLTPTEDTESNLAAFQADETGAITHLFVGTGNTLIKLAWYETTTVQEIYVLGLLLTFLSGWLVPLVPNLVRRLRHKSGATSHAIRWSQWLAGIYGLLACLFLIGMVFSLLTIDPNEFNFGIPISVKALLIIPWILLLLTPANLLFARVIWKRSEESFGIRLHYSLLTLAALLLIPFLFYWNLIVWPI